MANPRLYLGQIVDIDDPRKSGRARIRVFGLFDGLEHEDIPWASQISGVSFGRGGAGTISIPKLGSIVVVQFDGQNYYKMNYYGEKDYAQDMLDEIADSYEGAQVIMYDTEAEPGSLTLFYTKKKGAVFSLGDAKIQFDTQDGGQLRVIIEMGGDQIRMENNKVIVNSNNIELGEAAAQALIKGNTFQAYFNSHTHIGNLGAPTSPPVVPSTPDHLSTVSKTR
jgi:hypothetical protein